MDKYAFGTNRDTEIAEGSGRLAVVNAKYCEPRAYHGVNRYPSLQDKSFSLTIRAVDGCTLLETRVEHMHQAFQRLIDWSIDEVGQDASAAQKQGSSMISFNWPLFPSQNRCTRR